MHHFFKSLNLILILTLFFSSCDSGDDSSCASSTGTPPETVATPISGKLDTTFGTNGYFKYDGGNVDYAYAAMIKHTLLVMPGTAPQISLY